MTICYKTVLARLQDMIPVKCYLDFYLLAKKYPNMKLRKQSYSP